MADMGPNPKPPAIDPWTVEGRTGTIYPDALKSVVEGREKRAIGNALGIAHYGVNLVRLKPGAASALRHWHSRQDEMVYVLEGRPTLVTDSGEQLLSPGMAAGFPAGKADGHQLVNRSDADVVYLEIGDRTAGDEVSYSDHDLKLTTVDGKPHFTNRKGEPV